MISNSDPWTSYVPKVNESHHNQYVSINVVNQSLEILWKQHSVRVVIYSWPSWNCLGHETLELPHGQSPQYHPPPSLLPLASSWEGEQNIREWSEWNKWVLRSWGTWSVTGCPPRWPGLRGRQKMLWKAVHSGLLATDSDLKAELWLLTTAITEWWLLQYIHWEQGLFLLLLLVMSLTPVLSKCGKSYAWQPGHPSALFSQFVGKCREMAYEIKKGKYGNT